MRQGAKAYVTKPIKEDELTQDPGRIPAWLICPGQRPWTTPAGVHFRQPLPPGIKIRELGVQKASYAACCDALSASGVRIDSSTS